MFVADCLCQVCCTNTRGGRTAASGAVLLFGCVCIIFLAGPILTIVGIVLLALPNHRKEYIDTFNDALASYHARDVSFAQASSSSSSLNQAFSIDSRIFVPLQDAENTTTPNSTTASTSTPTNTTTTTTTSTTTTSATTTSTTTTSPPIVVNGAAIISQLLPATIFNGMHRFFPVSAPLAIEGDKEGIRMDQTTTAFLRATGVPLSSSYQIEMNPSVVTDAPFNLGGFELVRTIMNSVRCSSDRGCWSYELDRYCKRTYGGAASYVGSGCYSSGPCGSCAYQMQLAEICLVVSSGPSPPFRRGGELSSCFYPFDPTSHRYQVTTTTIGSSITVTIRRADDPFMVLQRLTKGSNDFGMDEETQRGLGIALLVVGVVLTSILVGVGVAYCSCSCLSSSSSSYSPPMTMRSVDTADAAPPQPQPVVATYGYDNSNIIGAAAAGDVEMGARKDAAPMPPATPSAYAHINPTSYPPLPSSYSTAAPMANPLEDRVGGGADNGYNNAAPPPPTSDFYGNRVGATSAASYYDPTSNTVAENDAPSRNKLSRLGGGGGRQWAPPASQSQYYRNANGGGEVPYSRDAAGVAAAFPSQPSVAAPYSPTTFGSNIYQQREQYPPAYVASSSAGEPQPSNTLFAGRY